MKINEIVLFPSREEPIENYQYLFDNAKREPAFNNLEFSQVFDLDEHYLGLFNSNKLISYLWISFREENKWQVSYSQTDLKFRRQGCFRYLLLQAVNMHNEILSDDHQTIESQNAWKALIKYPGGKFHIFLYNTKLNKILEKTYGLSDDKIWNQNEDTLLLVQKIQHSEKFLEHLNRDNEHKKKFGRDYNHIWFGTNSSNNEYDNP